MKVGVIGINHKLADSISLREALTKICVRRLSPLHFNPPHHFILLSTCNRSEVYFTSEDLAQTHSYLLGILKKEMAYEFDHKLYSYFGMDCFSHLTKVAAGLDSAVVGETEIQGQVKAAYEGAANHSLLPKDLHYLFQKSLGIAKKIRTQFELGRGRPNLEQAILQTGRHFFSQHGSPRLLFIGASEINLKVLQFLKKKNYADLTICNRSDTLSSAWSQKYEASFLPWKKLENWHTYDWIILGTKSPDFLIKEKSLPKSLATQKLIMDLSVPRNAEPQLGKHVQVTLLNIDEINRLLTLHHQNINLSISEAENKIVKETQAQLMRFQRREESKLVLLAV